MPNEKKKSAAKKAPAKKSAPKIVYIAYAPFEWMGKEYQEGDEFKPPADHTYDEEFEAFRMAEKLTDAKGVPFTYPKQIGEERDEATQKMVPITDDFRVILPVERQVKA